MAVIIWELMALRSAAGCAGLGTAMVREKKLAVPGEFGSARCLFLGWERL